MLCIHAIFSLCNFLRNYLSVIIAPIIFIPLSQSVLSLFFFQFHCNFKEGSGELYPSFSLFPFLVWLVSVPQAELPRFNAKFLRSKRSEKRTNWTNHLRNEYTRSHAILYEICRCVILHSLIFTEIRLSKWRQLLATIFTFNTHLYLSIIRRNSE